MTDDCFPKKSTVLLPRDHEIVTNDLTTFKTIILVTNNVYNGSIHSFSHKSKVVRIHMGDHTEALVLRSGIYRGKLYRESTQTHL